MESDFSFSRILFWCARSWTVINIALLLLFFVGEGFKPGSLTLREWSLFAFFPLGLAAGLVIAWWKELLGAIVAIAGLVGFYIVNAIHTGGLMPRGWAFLFFAGPAFLFLIHALLPKHAETVPR